MFQSGERKKPKKGKTKEQIESGVLLAKLSPGIGLAFGKDCFFSLFTERKWLSPEASPAGLLAGGLVANLCRQVSGF